VLYFFLTLLKFIISILTAQQQVPSDCKEHVGARPICHMGFEILIMGETGRCFLLGKSCDGPEEKRTDVYEPIIFVESVALPPFYG